MTGEIRIDWASAKVRERQLTVPLAEIAPKDWVKAVSDVVERLERSGQASGDVKVTRKKLRVSGVQPGVEPGLRHFLESALLQDNSGLDDDADDHDEGDDEQLSDADRQMTETFRSFAD